MNAEPITPLSSEDPPPLKPRLYYWPLVVVGLFDYYYAYSFVTLPWADKLWFGEIPVFALVQQPKMTLVRVVRDYLISLLPRFGLASGSPSPDAILTHPWALGITVTLPALVMLSVLALWPRVVHRRWLIASVVVVATLDAAVTFWFDATSRLSIF